MSDQPAADSTTTTTTSTNPSSEMPSASSSEQQQQQAQPKPLLHIPQFARDAARRVGAALDAFPVPPSPPGDALPPPAASAPAAQQQQQPKRPPLPPSTTHFPHLPHLPHSTAAAGGGGGGSSGSSTPSQEWLDRVRRVQQSKSPQLVMERLQQMARRHETVSHSHSKSRVLSKVAHASSAAWSTGMQQVMASPNMQEARQHSAQQQARMDVLQVQMRSADVVEEEAIELHPEEEAVTEDEMKKLLEQLRREPTDEDEIAAKFGLFEKYSETVETLRKEVFALWDGCKAEFDGAAKQSMERRLRSIDSENNMGVAFDGRCWFVHDMTARCAANNKILDANVREINTKLELLSRNDDCPICLEPIMGGVGAVGAVGGEGGGEGAGGEGGGEQKKPSTTLACCHKVCTECWDQWKLIAGVHGVVCPLCKQGAFIDVMFDRGGWAQAAARMQQGV